MNSKKYYHTFYYFFSNKFSGVLKKANFNNQKFIKKNIEDCKKKVKKKSTSSKTNLIKVIKMLFEKVKKLL